MDYFLHLNKEEYEVCSEASEDNEEMRNDIESLLYSAVHHRDFTQSLNPELDQGCSIEQSCLGELVVSLKEPSEFGIKKIENKQELTINNNMNPTYCTKHRENINQNFTVENNIICDTNNTVRLRGDKCNSPNKFKHHGFGTITLNKKDPALDVSYTNRSIIVNNECDWKHNSKLNFIPIEKKEENNIKNFQVILMKLSERYPYINEIELHNILNKISKLIKNPKHFTYNVITKKFQSFFKNKQKKSKTIQSELQQNNEKYVGEVVDVAGIDANNKPRAVEANYFGEKLQNDPSVQDIILPLIKNWLIEHPDWKVKEIHNRLKKCGYYCSLKNLKYILKSRLENIFKSKPIGNYFLNKIKSKSPLILNIENCRNVDTSIPVITIDSSDDELNVEFKSNTKKSIIAIPKNKQSFNLLSSCPPKKWTRKMVRFYDKESRRLASFDHEKILSMLRKNSSPFDWRVGDDDYTKQCKNKYDERKMLCTNCKQYGHGAFTCKRERKIPVCYMCGETGHKSSSCSQKKCLNCGDSSRSYCSMCSKCSDRAYSGTICEICGRKNHSSKDCTDLWRRFHNTIIDGEIVDSKQTPNARMCCSNCSKTGHFAHECSEDKNGINLCSPFVTNYNPLPLLSDYRNIAISLELYDKLQTLEGERFLQSLSNDFQSSIEIKSYDESFGHSLCFRGTPEEWHNIRAKLLQWAKSNCCNKKRKRKRKKKDIIPSENKQLKNHIQMMVCSSSASKRKKMF